MSTTGKIAAGDLSARVPTNPHDYPELRELAESINTMGESLARSEGLGRQFLLSVSHDLRTPLTSIRGYADAVADGATEDVVGAVGIIGSEARRLERLVQDLLDLARLDARQFSLHLERVECADVVETVTVGFQPEADANAIQLETVLPVDTPLWVDADPDRLGQVVANLVENAFKFASSKVLVGAGTVGAQTAIWVVDDGPGIAGDDLPHVFERHFSSDRAPTRKLGTGLGPRNRRRARRGDGFSVHCRVARGRRPRHPDDDLVRTEAGPFGPARISGASSLRRRSRPVGFPAMWTELYTWQKVLTLVLAIVGILALVVGFIYLALPAHSYPSFFPAYAAHGTKHGTKHGIAALVVGVVLLVVAALIPITARRRADY